MIWVGNLYPEEQVVGLFVMSLVNKFNPKLGRETRVDDDRSQKPKTADQ